jgi:hypothetical protein
MPIVSGAVVVEDDDDPDDEHASSAAAAATPIAAIPKLRLVYLIPGCLGLSSWLRILSWLRLWSFMTIPPAAGAPERMRETGRFS